MSEYDDQPLQARYDTPAAAVEEICPHCGEAVSPADIYCPSCQEVLDTAPEPGMEPVERVRGSSDAQRLGWMLIGGIGAVALIILVIALLVWPLLERLLP